MGGTKIDKPLEAVMSTDIDFFKDTKFTKKIFVLTDGQVSNSLSVIETISNHNSNNIHDRVYSIGIGNDVDKNLVIGIAEEGKGAHCLISSEALSQLKSKVIEILNKALYPSLIDCSFQWFNELRDT